MKPIYSDENGRILEVLNTLPVALPPKYLGRTFEPVNRIHPDRKHAKVLYPYLKMNRELAVLVFGGK